MPRAFRVVCKAGSAWGMVNRESVCSSNFTSVYSQPQVPSQTVNHTHNGAPPPHPAPPLRMPAPAPDLTRTRP